MKRRTVLAAAAIMLAASACSQKGGQSEVNIYDQRAAGLDYGTGGVPNFARVDPPYPKAAGQWNTYVITAKGPVITIELNGRQTAVIKDAKFLSGPFALQGGSHGKEPGGAIKWRKVQVREL